MTMTTPHRGQLPITLLTRSDLCFPSMYPRFEGLVQKQPPDLPRAGSPGQIPERYCRHALQRHKERFRAGSYRLDRFAVAVRVSLARISIRFAGGVASTTPPPDQNGLAPRSVGWARAAAASERALSSSGPSASRREDKRDTPASS